MTSPPGRGDEKMLPLAAERTAAIVLMHMKGEPRTMQKNPHYEDVVTEVADFFRQTIWPRPRVRR